MARAWGPFLKLPYVEKIAITRENLINDSDNTGPVPRRESLRIHEPSEICEDDIIVAGSSISNSPFSHGTPGFPRITRHSLDSSSGRKSEVNDCANMTIQNSGAIAHGPKGRYRCSNCRGANISCIYGGKQASCLHCEEHSLECGPKINKKQYRRFVARTQRSANGGSNSSSDAIPAISALFEAISVLETIERASFPEGRPVLNPDDLATRVNWTKRKVQYDEIEARYDIEWGSRLGRGTSSEVFPAYDNLTKEVFAIKVVYNPTDTKTELLVIDTITKDGSPSAHIIRVVDYFFHIMPREHVSRTFIKMQMCHGTLSQYLDERSNSLIEPLELTEIMSQVSSGLYDCHERGFCHRDLKLSNILFVNGACDCHQYHRSNKHWLITDFGFSMPVKGEASVYSSRRRGTETYRAPELVRDGEASRKSDIWAFGCVLLRVASMKIQHAFKWDQLAVKFKERLETPMPQLDVAHNSALLKATMCPDSGRVVPFFEQINSILEVCFAREPRDRPTAFQLKTRLEKIREALIGGQYVVSSHAQDLSYNTENSGQERSVEDGHVTVEQTLPKSLEEETS